MSLQVNGINEMLAEIEKMGKNVEQVKKKALTKGALLLRSAVAQNANAHRTTEQDRHLADNIVVSEILPGADGQDYVLVGPTAGKFYYGIFLELGTTKMRARPYLEPALLSKKDAVLEKIAEVIRGELSV